MTQPHPLMAKSKLNGRVLSLEQHSLDTEQSAHELFREGSRWAVAWMRFFKCADYPRFILNLRVAGLFHDIGKANEDFQGHVNHTVKEQRLRHEHVSALFLHVPELRAWLKKNPALDVEVITAAVLSHHLKASSDRDYVWGEPRGLGGQRKLVLFWNCPEVQRILERVAAVAGLPPAPDLSLPFWAPSTKAGDASWDEILQEGSRSATQLMRSVRRDAERMSLLLATKAGLIAADSVASGIIRVKGGETPNIPNADLLRGWLENVAHAEALSAKEIEAEVLAPRVAQIERKQQKPFTFHAFQELAAEQGPRALLLAGCGTGKTLAAWKWAKEQARQRAIGRVIFLYPTRGTATEGFRDYVGWAPEAKAALVHGTSEYELNDIEKNPSEATKGKNYQDESSARLFSLALWDKRYFSATVDQFLSFLSHSYGALCLLPALADSALIFDEVHSYDRKMFDALICLLKNFDVPVLCMTATMPPNRRDDLEKAGLSVYPRPQDQQHLQDLKAQEEHPRYELRRLSVMDEALPLALSAVEAKKRVLWVVNTVARCQQVAKLLQSKLSGVEVLVYHSRFTLKDRQKKHEQTVAAFQQKEQAAIAVTTQVCEMSLDLDADVLISERAPIPSLVQRFGRANRHAKPGDTGKARLYVYPPEKEAPYSAEEHRHAEAFLRAREGDSLNQRQLAESVEQYSTNETAADGSSSFLEGGYYALPGPLRDIDEHTSPCVLKRDFDAVGSGSFSDCCKNKKPYDGFLVPVPRSVPRENIGTTRPKWLPSFVEVVDDAKYSEIFGYLSDGGQP